MERKVHDKQPENSITAEMGSIFVQRTKDTIWYMNPMNCRRLNGWSYFVHNASLGLKNGVQVLSCSQYLTEKKNSPIKYFLQRQHA